MRARAGSLLAVAFLAACALALWPGAGAAAPDAQSQATLDRSVRYLQDAQNPDGGFGGRPGAPSDPDFSAWAAYALAAAGINPQDQAKPGGADVFTYLTQQTGGLIETTDFDRVALVALASGTSPYEFGPAHPIDTILARQLPDGSFAQQAGGRTGWVNATIWSIFPLSALRTPGAEAATARAGEWLLGQQRPDGSWGSTGPRSLSEADMTGAAIQALVAAGVGGVDAVPRALGYLRSLQGEDGGFREFAGGGATKSLSNSASTAWVLQGLWAAGVDPRQWRTARGADPLSFLASLQQPDGSIAWTASFDMNPLWMTAQAAPALAGRTYPLATVPRAVRPAAAPAPPDEKDFSPKAQQRTRGHGGEGVVAGDGVIAGGGGRGAPLFSAPQPQSGGSTRHGRRAVGVSSPEPRSGADGTAPGDGETAPVHRIGASSRSRGQSVEGVLVAARGDKAAPGLFAADRGGRQESAAGAIVALGALAMAAAGWWRERRVAV